MNCGESAQTWSFLVFIYSVNLPIQSKCEKTPTGKYSKFGHLFRKEA